MIGEWPAPGQLVSELPVWLREFGDPFGRFPVADLVELASDLLPHGAAVLIAFCAKPFGLLAGHGQVRRAAAAQGRGR
ncbi:hypothetical protein [Streptomyces puniciscabiei]|uniref:hypothetical protein n=1 Tax=Streptomyces puniciscabiei TaxID=164348 RepID=UPI00379AD1CE